MRFTSTSHVTSLSFGCIIKSKYYISFEWKNKLKWGYYFGPTYNGTKTGCLIRLGKLSILAHIRG